METIEKVNYWINSAEDNLITAKDNFFQKHFLFSAFLCHLKIEKGLKAIIAQKELFPPKVHNLLKLAVLSNLEPILTVEQKDILEILTPFNIEARYPSYKKTVSEILDENTCHSIILQTEELFIWIKNKLFQ
jgi:HEPN domain-containing protein